MDSTVAARETSPARARTAMIAPPETVCPERVRHLSRNAEGANSARKRSGTRTADGGGGLNAPRGFWRAVDLKADPPTEGERRRRGRLISQVTGQKGGRRLACGGALPRFFGRWTGASVGQTDTVVRSCTRSSAPASSTSAAGTCRCSTARRSVSTTPCAAPRAFSTSRTCASVDLKGPRVRAFLADLLANDVGKLKSAGKALYSCMLNERGGVIDDSHRLLPQRDPVPRWW